MTLIILIVNGATSSKPRAIATSGWGSGAAQTVRRLDRADQIVGGDTVGGAEKWIMIFTSTSGSSRYRCLFWEMFSKLKRLLRKANERSVEAYSAPHRHVARPLPPANVPITSEMSDRTPSKSEGNQPTGSIGIAPVVAFARIADFGR
ncbi:MAG: hypothetical protein JF608_02285 [Sphingomonadales bacterium]|jgi:hypothetical protein|nr:hypothetical protein [Sphingomonadales bacterium]